MSDMMKYTASVYGWSLYNNHTIIIRFIYKNPTNCCKICCGCLPKINEQQYIPYPQNRQQKLCSYCKECFCCCPLYPGENEVRGTEDEEIYKRCILEWSELSSKDLIYTNLKCEYFRIII